MSLEDKKNALDYFDQIDDAIEGDPEFFKYYSDAPDILADAERHQGRPLGFETLDAITGGVSSGELIVITAPTGVGKTTFCQSISWTLARAGHPVLWYTLELSLAQFLKPYLDNDEGVQWDQGGKLLKTSKYPIYFPKEPEKLDFKTLKRVMRYAHDEFGVQHVFIDHLHYLLDHRAIERSRSISLHIGDRLRGLRQLALETGVSIFLVAHMQKTEDGKRPTLSDIRDSSFIGQEADLVLTLWRERLKSPITKMIGDVEYEETFSPITNCAIEKSRRTGRKGLCYLGWEKGLYYELSKAQVDLILKPETS
jgi:replicative DNA helicase